MTTTPYTPGDTQAEVVATLTNTQTVTDNLVPAGTTQANALVLGPPARFFRAPAVTAGTGVTLPSLAAAFGANPNAGANVVWCIIRNDDTTNALKVYGNNSAVTVGGANYPASADKINGATTATAFSIPALKSCLFFANAVTAAGNWCTLLSA